MSTKLTHTHYVPVREDWLASRPEAALDPGQPIIDPHHHLWDRPGWRYLIDEFVADLNQGHDVRATVFVQCRAMHRADGPEAMQPVGETEFVNGIAAMSESGGYGRTKICAGIVGYADMRLGDAVRPVLEAHIAAGGGRFRGIRHIATWDSDPVLLNPAYTPPEDMLDSASFRAGFAHLGALDLSFDAWLFHPQITKVVSLARAFPNTRIVLDHVGGPAGIGQYAGKRDEVFANWSKSIRELATCPNVMVKLGGLGMRVNAFHFEDAPIAPSSEILAQAWKPYVETCIAAFGSARCMFESNFPVDKGSYSYGVGWNAFKRLASGCSAEEKADLFWRAAANFYRLPKDILEPRG